MQTKSSGEETFFPTYYDTEQFRISSEKCLFPFDLPTNQISAYTTYGKYFSIELYININFSQQGLLLQTLELWNFANF